MSHLSIQSLHIRLSGVDILQSLDLEIGSGEFLVLLGPSGCGKSTLLHSIAGLIELHDGSMSIGGCDVTWADPKDRGIGMVFQSYALYPTMTVERNMSFGPSIAGVAKPEIARRVERTARMLHLTELLQRKPAQLSGGQRQRVAIGRALVRDADVLLFDEPLSNLDAKLRAELRRELKQLHKDLGATMVYVTHDQVEAMTLATRIAVMKDGRIQQIDTPAEVYGRPANMFVAGFLGSPGINFVEGRLECQRFVSNAFSVDVSGYQFLRAPASGMAVVLGVRPEDISLSELGSGAQAAAKVSLVEPMGANDIVWLDANGVSLAVVSDQRFETMVDNQVSFSIVPDKVSIFHAQTQQRL